MTIEHNMSILYKSYRFTDGTKPAKARRVALSIGCSIESEHSASIATSKEERAMRAEMNFMVEKGQLYSSELTAWFPRL